MCSGAAGGGLHPVRLQDLLRHLEELLATPALAGLGSAVGVAAGRQELQDVDLNHRHSATSWPVHECKHSQSHKELFFFAFSACNK